MTAATAYVSAIAGYALVASEDRLQLVSSADDELTVAGTTDLQQLRALYPDVEIINAGDPPFSGVRERLREAVSDDRLTRLVLSLLDDSYPDDFRRRSAELIEKRLERSPETAEFLTVRLLSWHETCGVTDDALNAALRAGAPHLWATLSHVRSRQSHARVIESHIHELLRDLAPTDQERLMNRVHALNLVGALSLTGTRSPACLVDKMRDESDEVTKVVNDLLAFASEQERPSSLEDDLAELSALGPPVFGVGAAEFVGVAHSLASREKQYSASESAAASVVKRKRATR